MSNGAYTTYMCRIYWEITGKFCLEDVSKI
jgi:hypothetical protein